MDPKTSSCEELRWVRLELEIRDLRAIPRQIAIVDHGKYFPSTISIEGDYLEESHDYKSLEFDEKLVPLLKLSVKGMNNLAPVSGWWDEHRPVNKKDLNFKKVVCREVESGKAGYGGASDEAELMWARKKGKGVAVAVEGDVDLESVRVQSTLKGPDYRGCDRVQQDCMVEIGDATPSGQRKEVSTLSMGDWSRVNNNTRKGGARKSLAKVGEEREEVYRDLNWFVALQMKELG